MSSKLDQLTGWLKERKITEVECLISDLTGIARGVLVLQGGMPTAVFSYLLSARYDRDPEDVAGIVLVSTLVSAASLPFLISYVLWIS